MKKLIILLHLSISILAANAQTTTTCGSEIDLNLIQQVNPARYQRIMALEQQT